MRRPIGEVARGHTNPIDEGCQCACGAVGYILAHFPGSRERPGYYGTMPLFAWALWATTLVPQAAQPAREVALPPLEERCSRSLSMAGFSDNERAYAVAEALTCTNADGTWDTYSIIDVIDAATTRVLARYQATPILRHKGKNAPVFVPPSKLAQQNPAYRSASAQPLWQKLRRGGHFGQKRHDFADVLIRLRRDPDSRLDVAAHKTELLVKIPARASLGFTVVGRLVNGLHMDMGHFRDSANLAVPHTGRLEAIFSKHGHLVASLYHPGYAKSRDGVLCITQTPPEQPIGSTHVGFMQMLEWDADSVEELYGDLHPEGKAVWKEMIGPLE